jgi:hypothetical protein
LNWHFSVVPFQTFELANAVNPGPGVQSRRHPRARSRLADSFLPSTFGDCRVGPDPHQAPLRRDDAPRCGAVSRYASLEGVSRTLFTACAFLGHQQLDRQSGTDSSFGFGIHAPTLDQPWESQDSFQPRDRLHRRRISKTRFVALRTPALPLQEQGGANRDVS